MKITIRVPYLPPSGQVNGKEPMFVRANRREQQRKIMRGAWVKVVGPGPCAPRFEAMLITFTRQSLQERALDDDNNVSAFKSLRDELAAMLHHDDGCRRLKFRYKQERAPMVPVTQASGLTKIVRQTGFVVVLESVASVDALPEF